MTDVIQKHITELCVERAAVEDQMKAALGSLEATKEQQSNSHVKLQEAGATGQAALTDALADVSAAGKKLGSLIKDAEEEAAVMQEQICQQKEAVARTEEIISTKSLPTAVVLLTSHAAELEVKLERQRDANSKLHECAEERGASNVPAVATAPLQDCPAVAAPARRSIRVFSLSPAVPELAGEYRLLTDPVNERPAYARRGAAGSAGTVYLFWCRFAWTFGKELPGMADERGYEAALARGQGGAGVPGVLAWSLQAAWAAFPDELASPHWSMGNKLVEVMLLSTNS